MSRDLKAKEKDVLYEKPKGIGKPLSGEVLDGDVLDRTVKYAGYLPERIKLQHEVRDRLSIKKQLDRLDLKKPWLLN